MVSCQNSTRTKSRKDGSGEKRSGTEKEEKSRTIETSWTIRKTIKEGRNGSRTRVLTRQSYDWLKNRRKKKNHNVVEKWLVWAIRFFAKKIGPKKIKKKEKIRQQELDWFG